MTDRYRLPRLLSIVVTLAMLLVPSAARAWGFEAHRFIMDRAIDLLPPEIRPAFAVDRAFLLAHTIDPDLWRTAGFREEDPRHFLNLDAYGDFPFADLPRSYERAVEVFGADVVARNGVLPWRAAEVADWLSHAFEEAGSGASSHVNLRFYAAVLAHYLADAHVPFHATLNFDGQLTGQRGIHARWESELFNRYRSQLAVEPAAVGPVSDVETVAFEALLSGFQIAAEVLAADHEAKAEGPPDDDRYFEAFFAATRPALERRLEESITAVASAITFAWERAGRPPVTVEAFSRPAVAGNR